MPLSTCQETNRYLPHLLNSNHPFKSFISSRFHYKIILESALAIFYFALFDSSYKTFSKPVPHMTSWRASMSKYVSRQHLEGSSAAAIIILGYLYIKNQQQKAAHTVGTRHHRCQVLGMLHGGKMAMQRLLDAKRAQVDPSALKDAEQQLKNVLDGLDGKRLDLDQLQSAVAMLEMSGKEDLALEMLHDAAKKAQKHEKYEIEMCIVEMHIYEGDFDAAINQDCLKDPDITDARRPLYKAFVHIMKGQEGDSKKCWEEFQGIRNHLKCDCFHCAEIHNLFVEFDDFKKAAQLLQKEIQAHKKPKTVSKTKNKQNE